MCERAQTGIAFARRTPLGNPPGGKADRFGGGRSVMSTPVSTSDDSLSATMYAPPWARDGARDGVRDEAREGGDEALYDAPVAAGENALAASEQFRRTLPPASQLGEKRRRRETPFEGDLAAIRLRERPTLEPVAVPAPPAEARGSSVGLMARVVGAIGLSALAAFFMVGTAPLSLAVKAEGEIAPSLWTRFTSRTTPVAVEPAALTVPAAASAPAVPAAAHAVAVEPMPAALAERFAAAQPEMAIRPRPVQTVSVPVVPEPPARPRALDPDEVAILYKRSQDLITQGDIAGGRLLLTRAAEGGDARAAFALGSTYDPAVLGRMGVLGVKPDIAKARDWYAKAAEYGSGEAARRLEQIAHAAR
jgi:hypothetical protein